MPHARLLIAILMLAGFALLVGQRAHGGIPGDLVVAVTADGKRLVGGGKTRALYEIDPQTLEVKARVHLGRGATAMAFSPDGNVLVVETAKAMLWLDSKTFKPIKTDKELDEMVAVPAIGLGAFRHRKSATIRILSLADASEKGVLPYDKMQSVAAFGLSPDAKKLALLYYRKRDKEEKKVPYKEIPKDLKGAKLNEFKQRNDGNTARYLVFDVAAGKSILDKKLWYTAPGGGNTLYWSGDKVFVVSYENQNALIDAQGEVTYFELGNSYNYAMGCMADGSALLTGGLRDASRTTLPDLKITPFELDRLEGFPEYFRSFSFAADGTGYAGTTGWRVIRITPDGKVDKAAPVY